MKQSLDFPKARLCHIKKILYLYDIQLIICLQSYTFGITIPNKYCFFRSGSMKILRKTTLYAWLTA